MDEMKSAFDRALERAERLGKLSPEEWAAIKRHPVDGSAIVSKMKGVGENTAKIILEHHAKYDLTGYPSFSKGYSLEKGSLIVAIADTYDSMTTLRPYQKRSNHSNGNSSVSAAAPEITAVSSPFSDFSAITHT